MAIEEETKAQTTCPRSFQDFIIYSHQYVLNTYHMYTLFLDI